MRPRLMLLAALTPTALAAAPAPADPPADSVPPAPLASATSPESAKKEWDFSLTLTANIVPDDRDYLQPTFTADRDTLHLELRYNYEDIDTGSVWAGYNFSAGTDLTVDFTPMIGVVAGDTDGLAPGYELTLTYGKFELYTEGEFLFDVEESSDSFFYTWTELSFAPVDWFRFGLVIQRNKTSDTHFDIDRGLLLGLSHDNLSFTAYLFNLGWDDPMVVLAFGIEF
jgi:hypothetical protein